MGFFRRRYLAACLLEKMQRFSMEELVASTTVSVSLYGFPVEYWFHPRLSSGSCKHSTASLGCPSNKWEPWATADLGARRVMQWWKLLGLFGCPGFADCCRMALLGRRGRSRGKVPGEQDRMEKQNPGNFCPKLAERFSVEQLPGSPCWLDQRR